MDLISYNLIANTHRMQDLLVWWDTKALPSFRVKLRDTKWTIIGIWTKGKYKILGFLRLSGGDEQFSKPKVRDPEDLISIMGPSVNIMLPGNGDEAVKRLMMVGGQDPYRSVCYFRITKRDVSFAVESTAFFC